MNDTNKKSSAMFTPSGCLTGEALMLYVSGSLEDNELQNAQQHVTDCPLCADAADGLRMWLKENKPVQPDTAFSTPLIESETSVASDKHVHAPSHRNMSNGSGSSLFHSRTNVINDRIKQRLHKHALIEEEEEKRLSYKPFVWLAAAATIVLFIGGFYVLWVQNQFDSQKLAQSSMSDSVNEMAVINDSALSNSQTLATNGNSKMEKKQVQTKVRFVAPAVISEEVEDADVFNQDDMAQNNPSVNQAVPYEMPDTIATSAFPTEIAGVVVNASRVVSDKKSMGYSVQEESKAQVVEIEGKEVFTIVEEMPQYPGGEEKRLKFLAENIQYPVAASESGIQGTVYVSFVVNTNGKLVDVKILRGIGGGCDEEALRVIKQMPRWTPGKQNGKTVRVLYNMPIIFRLQN
jgi:TonB family protein